MLQLQILIQQGLAIKDFYLQLFSLMVLYKLMEHLMLQEFHLLIKMQKMEAQEAGVVVAEAKLNMLEEILQELVVMDLLEVVEDLETQMLMEMEVLEVVVLVQLVDYNQETMEEMEVKPYFVLELTVLEEKTVVQLPETVVVEVEELVSSLEQEAVTMPRLQETEEVKDPLLTPTMVLVAVEDLEP